MIESQTELRVAFRNLQILEQSLRALREQLRQENPDLLSVTETPYLRRIEALQQEIAAYLYRHPADVSSLLPPESVPGEKAIAT